MEKCDVTKIHICEIMGLVASQIQKEEEDLKSPLVKKISLLVQTGVISNDSIQIVFKFLISFEGFSCNES